MNLNYPLDNLADAYLWAAAFNEPEYLQFQHKLKKVDLEVTETSLKYIFQLPRISVDLLNKIRFPIPVIKLRLLANEVEILNHKGQVKELTLFKPLVLSHTELVVNLEYELDPVVFGGQIRFEELTARLVNPLITVTLLKSEESEELKNRPISEFTHPYSKEDFSIEN